MERSESDRLGWVPCGRGLIEALHRAEVSASEHTHRELTLEHVILALTDDPDAARVLDANGVRVPGLRDYVARYVAALDDRRPGGTPGPPEADENLKRIFDIASAAADSSGRHEIDGALIVAAIIGEGKSNAAAMLRQHGLSLEDGGSADARQTTETPPVAVNQAPAVPRMPGAGSVTQDVVAPVPGLPQQDLSAIHRMLSQTGDSTLLANGGIGSGSLTQRMQPDAMGGYASPRDVLPALQRTRPKIAPAKTNAPPRNGRSPISKASLVRQGRDGASPAGPEQTSGSARLVDTTAQERPPSTSPPVFPPVVLPVNVGKDTAPAPTETQVDVADYDTVDSAPPPVEGFAQIDVNILNDILPRKMRLGAPEMIEIRVMNSDIDALTGQFEGRDVAHSGAKLVSRSLSLRLRSPSGSFVIEPRSPEVQWIDADAGLAEEDVTSWRWQVTGHRPGKARLQLVACARTVNSDGVALETAMPEQVASLRINRGIGAIFRRFVAISGLFLAGCAAGFLARPIYRLIEGFLA